MNDVRSSAWDGYSAGVALVCVLVALGSVARVATTWPGAHAGFSGWFRQIVPVLVAVFLLMIAWFYARDMRCRLVFTKQGVVGLVRGQTLAYFDVAAWAVKGSLLIVWPSSQKAGGLSPVAPHARPGVPLNTVWAKLEPSKVEEVSALLTRRVGRQHSPGQWSMWRVAR